MRKKAIINFTFFSFFLLFITTILIHRSELAYYNNAHFNSSFVKCSSLRFLSKDDCFESTILLYNHKLGLRTTIKYQEMAIKKLGDFGECHTISHLLGKLGYSAYLQGQLINYSSCGDGYVHGFLEASIEDGGFSKLYKAMGVICGKSTAQLEDCFHGVGHGLYLAGKSISFTAFFCGDKNFNNLSKELRIFYCFRGFAMQKDFNSTLTLSGPYDPKVFKYDKVRDLFNLCNIKDDNAAEGLCLMEFNRYILDDQFYMAPYYKVANYNKYKIIIKDAFTYAPVVARVCDMKIVKLANRPDYSCFSELGADVASLAYSNFSFNEDLTIKLERTVCGNDDSLDCDSAYLLGLYEHLGSKAEKLALKSCSIYMGKRNFLCRERVLSIKAHYTF